MAATLINTDLPDFKLQAFVDGDFQFNLNGIAGQTYDVFYTTDLETWIFLEKVTLTGPSVLVTDDDPAGRFRFYRAEEGSP